MHLSDQIKKKKLGSMKYKINAYKILFGNSERKRPLVRTRHR